MNTLRTNFQKAMKGGSKSGASPAGKTPRQREVLRLCAFLTNYVKGAPSCSSYSRDAAHVGVSGRTTSRPVMIKVNNNKTY